MAVVFWKMHHEEFNALVGKTTLDLAAEKYAESGAAEDLQHLRHLLSARRPLSASEIRPLDIVVNRVAETGCTKDLRMLRALVKAKRHTPGA